MSILALLMAAAGAAAGAAVLIRPTAYSNNSGYANPANAYDGSTTTYADDLMTVPFNLPQTTDSCIWSFSQGGIVTGKIHVLIAIPSMPEGSAHWEYSLDGGSTWSAPQALASTAQTTVLSTQFTATIANVKVKISCDYYDINYDGSTSYNEIQVFDIWIA